MKGRIIDNLYAFSKPECPQKHSGLMQIISEETGMPIQEIRGRSQQLLKNIIHNYASFEVSTIDGFTHRVLRTFAKDLDLPLNFEVELNTEEVLQEAVENLINKAGEDKQLTQVLVNFAIGKADEDKSWDIARDLFKIAELLTKETNQPFLNLLKSKKLEDFEKLAGTLKEQMNLLEKDIILVADKFFELLEKQGLEKSDFNGKYCPGFFEKLQKKNFKVGFDAGWQLNLGKIPLYPKRIEDHKKELLDKCQPEIVNLYKEEKQNLTNLEFLQAVKKNLSPLSLLSAIQDEIEEIKKERSIVLISEFNATIGSTVKDQPAPFIYERLGERYQHYFIDEFQDTSQLQWENLIPLIDHAISGKETGSLTLVGDAKQSIYRWRGGKAEQFMDLCLKGNPFNIEEKKIVVLPHNYRSSKEIVDFNNDFFTYSSRCFSNVEHQNLFKDTSSQKPVNSGGGYVNLSFVDADSAEEEMQVVPEKVLEIIKDLEDKNIPKSNICILTRTGKQGIAIANFLSEHQIPIISFQSLLVSRSPEVCFITAMLQFSIEGKEKSIKLEILEFLLERKIETEDRYRYISKKIHLEDEDFINSLEEEGIAFNLKKLTDFSLYEAVEYIIRSFDLVKNSNAYVQFFMDFVYEASQKDQAGIFEFLKLWEQKKDVLSIVAPKSEDAVQILTIHKAKGLEFPVVIYPFANSNIEDVARESLWMSLPETLQEGISIGYLQASKKMMHWGEEASLLYEDLCRYSQLDALNVLYVALTRPVQQLYVISKMDLDRKGQENTNKTSGLFISWLKHKGIWDGNAEYEFGNANEFVLEEEIKNISFQQEKFYSSPTQGKGISIITRSGLLWDSKQEKAIEKGHLIHDILAAINTADDAQAAIEQAREKGFFKNEEEDEVAQAIYNVIKHPEIKDYFCENADNYNERDLITETGEVFRPDRLNFSGKEVSVIDYKTGDAHTHHREQVNGYSNVLAAMGFEVAKKILVYINEEVSVSIL